VTIPPEQESGAVKASPGFPVLFIEALAYCGDGVARHEGRVVFVPDALPGDTARVRIVQDKGSYLRGEVLERCDPSSDRVEPFCPLADRCGGCQWQELAYPVQLRWKRGIVEESLRRIGGFKDARVEECLPSPVDRGWRTVARFPAATVNGRFTMGYYERRSHRIVDVVSCPLASDRVNRIGEAVRGLEGIERADVREITIRASWNHPSALVSVLLGRRADMRACADALLGSGEGIEGVSLWHEDAHTGLRRLRVFGSPYRTESVNGRTFRIEERSFFQVNIPQAERLVRLAGEMLRLENGIALVDGYGGVGLFSLGFAPTTAEVRLFDIAEWAVDDAAHNARALGFARFAVHTGDAKTALAALGAAGRLILDPPRTGLGLTAVEAICRFDAPRIVYVSCNPTTLARDLRAFAEREYRVARVTPVDMFPHTYHIETVAELFRGE
jgi:23S rRNA (uracil1939-C5)-methyltransferase